MTELHERIQDLPPELFTEIYHLVFAFNVSRVTIDHNYRPPAQLQVSAETWYQYADAFYGKTVFEFKQPSIFYKWVRGLSKAHLEMVGGIEFQVQVPRSSDSRLSGPLIQAQLDKIQGSEGWELCSEVTGARMKLKFFRSTGDEICAPIVTPVAVNSDCNGTLLDWSNGSVGFSWSNGYMSLTDSQWQVIKKLIVMF